MAKKLFIAVLVGMIIPIVIFLGFSFANVSFNIVKWNWNDRGLCAMLGIMFFFVSAGIIFHELLNEEK